MDNYYIQVILPLKLSWVPVYFSREPLEAGQCVDVVFAHRKYTGIVWREDTTPDIDSERIQEISQIERNMPRISQEEIRFWEFIADYYLCTIGEVFNAAYPSFRIRSEKVQVSALERLRKNLDKCEAALLGKHQDRVIENLKKERSVILEKIAVLTNHISQRQIKRASDKPILINGTRRLSQYSGAIRKVLKEGGQVLILTPEIALCNRLEALMSPEFGEELNIANSTITPQRRRKIADTIRSGSPSIVLGTRSAVFLPFTNLSLVIVDEEQDPSYKQTEPAPRYNGRDAALVLARIHSAQVILGSSCPSFESIYNCNIGKYSIVKDGESKSTLLAPTDEHEYTVNCSIIDLVAEKRKKGVIGNFSRKLIAETLATEGNIIFIRAWERQTELDSEIEALFPSKDIRIMTLAEFKRQVSGKASLIAVLQADALLAKDDYRSDERAAQLLSLFQQFASKVIIQTAIPSRFDSSRSIQDLMNERREFNYPPYTRLVVVKSQKENEVLEMHFLKRGPNLHSDKAKLVEKLPKNCYLDVDP